MQQTQSSRNMMMMMMGRGGAGMTRPVGPTGMGMMPGMMQGGSTGSANKTAQEREDENLVEMTVYGIATLYRRLDPPKTEAQPGQAGQPTTPAPAGATR
jgi:hypothetical protein